MELGKITLFGPSGACTLSFPLIFMVGRVTMFSVRQQGSRALSGVSGNIYGVFTPVMAHM